MTGIAILAAIVLAVYASWKWAKAVTWTNRVKLSLASMPHIPSTEEMRLAARSYRMFGQTDYSIASTMIGYEHLKRAELMDAHQHKRQTGKFPAWF